MCVQKTAATPMNGGNGVKRSQTPKTQCLDDRAVSAAETSPSSTEQARDGGFVSNASLEENELEAFCAPEYALEEEKKLREAREKEEEKEKDGDAASREETALLEKNKYAQLDRLLDQSKLYTQFLSEQMSTAQESTMQSAEKEAMDKKKKKKKRRQGQRRERERPCRWRRLQQNCVRGSKDH